MTQDYVKNNSKQISQEYEILADIFYGMNLPFENKEYKVIIRIADQQIATGDV